MIRELNIKEYQNELISILKKVKLTFDNNNVDFWIHSGTLLGHVRDDGFIPWDDDIDLMTSYYDWKNKRKSIEQELEEQGLKIIELNINNEEVININLVKIISTEKVILNNLNHNEEVFPFIDLFFAVSKDSYKTNFGWFWNQTAWRSLWIVRRGFNRYERNSNRKIMGLVNFITYPFKIFGEKWLLNFLDKPYKKKKSNDLRRSDPWGLRNVIYNKNDLIEIDFKGAKVMMNKNYVDELIESYGKKWNEYPKKKKTHFNKKTLFKHDIYIKKIMSEYETGESK